MLEREALWLGAALTCGLAGFAIASARLDALDIAVVAACLVISLVSLPNGNRRRCPFDVLDEADSPIPTALMCASADE